MSEQVQNVMSVRNLSKVFKSGVFKPKYTVAVQDVSFDIKPGTIISLIGESGSGKTTIGKLILKLIKPSSGKIYYKGKDIEEIRNKDELKEYYKKVQGIFQDPFATFNPLYRVDRIFDMIYDSFGYDKSNKEERIHQVLQDVNLVPERTLGKFPHQLSGGQLQRLLIARALLMDVDVLIADELISMLDASTRIGVLNLLVELTEKKGMSVIFITHDLNLGYYISDESLIMYKGRLVESGDTKKIYESPVHPYTKMLFNSVPEIGKRWDPEEEFLPEQVIKDVEEFYKENAGKGFAAAGENHYVLYSID
ncbi:MAG: ABC transporter ATP-binding protein [Halanaerobiales bacterium]